MKTYEEQVDQLTEAVMVRGWPGFAHPKTIQRMKDVLATMPAEQAERAGRLVNRLQPCEHLEDGQIVTADPSAMLSMNTNRPFTMNPVRWP